MIYAELGERLTQALLTADFGLFRSVVCLPLTMAPRDRTPYHVDTEAALRKMVAAYVSMIRLHRVTDLYRQITATDRTGPGEITVVFQLWVLSGGTRVVAPFVSTHHLLRTSEGWKIGCIEGSLGQTNWYPTQTADRRLNGEGRM